MSDLSGMEEPYLEPGTFVLMGLDLLLDSVNFAMREDAPLEWLDVLGKMKEFCLGAKEVVEALVGHPWNIVPFDVGAIQLDMVQVMYQFKAAVDSVTLAQQKKEDLELLKAQVAEAMTTIQRIQERNEGQGG